MNETKQQVNLWIGNQPNPDDRLKILVSDDDMRKVGTLRGDRTQKTVRIKDINTGRNYRVRAASCGLICRCALALVPWNRKRRGR